MSLSEHTEKDGGGCGKGCVVGEDLIGVTGKDFRGNGKEIRTSVVDIHTETQKTHKDIQGGTDRGRRFGW